MRLRTAHLACVLLLLSSLGAAEGTTLRSRELGLGSHYISLLLREHTVRVSAETPLSLADGEDAAITVPSADRALSRIVWAMRPPSAHAVALHAVTGSTI